MQLKRQAIAADYQLINSTFYRKLAIINVMQQHKDCIINSLQEATLNGTEIDSWRLNNLFVIYLYLPINLWKLPSESKQFNVVK